MATRRATSAGGQDEEARADPTAVVLAFARVFTAWERAMGEADTPFRDRKLKREHARILARYCTVRPRAYVDGALAFKGDGTYTDVTADAVKAVRRVRPGRAHVDVSFRRFVVFKKRDGWRIDGVKVKGTGGRGWDNVLIGS